MSAARRTRILYVNHTGLMSGAEHVLLNLLRGIDRARFEPIVLCPGYGGLASEILQLGIEWIPIPTVHTRFSWRAGQFRSMGSLVSAVRAVRHQIRALSPDFVHANSTRAGIVASLAAAGTGKEVIWHIHDTLPRNPLGTAIRAFALLGRKTSVVAVSQATANAFRGRLPSKREVRTIYNGVDLSRFPLKSAGESAFRTRLAIPADSFLVCAIGQICERKGLLELVDAVRGLRTQAPNLHLAIVGRVVFRHEEKYLSQLRSAVRASGIEDRVHFVGELSDVSPALQAADLLVLNSRDEPFGLVLIEAMSCGTPVLAARVGGIPEIVTDSENGWLVDSGDTHALATKLLALSRDRIALAQVADAARETTCPKFSLQRFHGDWTKFYGELDPHSASEWNLHRRPLIARTGQN